MESQTAVAHQCSGCGHLRDEHICWPAKFVRGQVGDRWTQCLAENVMFGICPCAVFSEEVR